MPYYISGVTAEHTSLVARTPEEFKSQNDVDMLTGYRALEVDPERHTVKIRRLATGQESASSYSKLLITTGADAIVPPVEGTGLTGVFTLRKLADSVRLKDYIVDASPSRAVIVGAGPIGLEMCEAFLALGIGVTLIEAAPQVMPLIEPGLASMVQGRLAEEGVECVLGQVVTGIAGDAKGTVREVETAGGRFAADIVLMAIGVRPATGLAEGAGVELGARGAIRVDGGMRTSIEDIYAAGDCATTTHAMTGREVWLPLGSTSRKQGRAAADSMYGPGAEFGGVQGTAVVKCLDLTVGRTGLSEKESADAGHEPVTIEMEAESLLDYYPDGGTMSLVMVADRPTGRVLGAQLVGRISSVAEKRLDILAVAIGAGLTADDLQYLDLAYAPPYSAAVDVPIIAGNLMVGRLKR